MIRSAIFVLVITVACSERTADQADAGSSNAAPRDAALLEMDAMPGAPRLTFHRDVRPILAARCLPCHTSGGIAPISFERFEDVRLLAPAIAEDVASGRMPPWPPASGCNQYRFDRSLSNDERTTLLEWVAEGAPEGDPADAPGEVTPREATLSRVDRAIRSERTFTPPLGESYRCFLLPYAETEPKYLTGYNIRPQNRVLLHHGDLYAIAPNAVAEYRRLDAEDEAGGFACDTVDSGTASFLAAWTPGGAGTDFPPETGILIEGGSEMLIQVHFSTQANEVGLEESPLVELRLEDQVARRAAALPFYDFFTWPRPGGMPIPAGEREVVFSFEIDPNPFRAQVIPWVTASNRILVYGSAIHMHALGSAGRVDIVRPGERDCLLDIPRWDLAWANAYELAEPEIFELGRDRLRVECRFDNSAAHQPLVNGARREPRDVEWGPTADDEMCIGFVFVTGE
jgi:hypothetical protein